MWIRRLAVFLGALFLYLICLDRGASLWDCPEYILIAWKMEVGHPPGNPTWQLMANVLSHLGASAQHAAVIINAFSAVSMALASAILSGIIFLFLRATFFPGSTRRNIIAANLCAACGALCYAWCDSAIFSAVEAEVYALSALFTVAMIRIALQWAIMRRRGNVAMSLRLIILLAYIAGLGVGVHELNFLIIPVLLLIFYYGAKKYPIAGAPVKQRRFIPRTDGLPTVAWSVCLFLVGVSTYLIIPIRAAANPPVNTCDPSTPERLRSYYARDMYGSKPLLYGPTPYSTPLLLEQRDSITGEYLYTRYYVEDNGKGGIRNVYPDELNMWFPRLTSRDKADIEFYEIWAGMKPEAMVKTEASVVVDSAGNQMGRMNPLTGEREKKTTYRPTYMQQARYFLGYQVGYMYLRYLLWNFAGKQNDVHSTGGRETGNFITGIAPLDNAMLGDQNKLPASMREKNPGYNRYYMIPLIMGIIGILALISAGSSGRRVLAITALFFLFTGVLIVVYLNQDPGEPRERDYSFLGSYMAYAIWIACGMAAVVKGAFMAAKNRTAAIAARTVAVAVCMAVPLLMLSQTYDDHNRSSRKGAEEVARTLLEPVEKDAIVMVYGDNLIFPLWYAQEVLGMRPDVTIVATPYLPTEWYRNQLRVGGEKSKPLVISEEIEPGTSMTEAVIQNIIDLNGGSRPIYRSNNKGKLDRLTGHASE